MVQGVCVTVYETSGFAKQQEQHQKMLKDLLVSGSISVTVYCFIDFFKACSDIGVDWSKTVIALTFADSLSVPKSVSQDPNYKEGSGQTTEVQC